MSELSRPLLRSDLRQALNDVDMLTKAVAETATTTDDDWSPALTPLARIERALRDAYDAALADGLAAVGEGEAR